MNFNFQPEEDFKISCTQSMIFYYLILDSLLISDCKVTTNKCYTSLAGKPAAACVQPFKDLIILKQLY